MSDDVSVRRCTGRTAAGARCRRIAEEGSTRCAQHGYKMPGRPSKLTPELTQAIVYLILEGNYLATAAQANGVSERTLHHWRRRGEEAIARAEEAVESSEELLGDGLYEHVDPAEWPYVDFLHALKSAEAFAETELLRRAASGDFGWQAPMTVLERRHPMRWRRRERLDVGGDDGGAVPIKVVAPDTEAKRTELLELVAELNVLTDTAPPAPEHPRKRKKGTA